MSGNDAMFQASADASVLASILAELKVGQLAEYSQLSASIGRDVCGAARGALATARRQVQREQRMIFDAVRARGLRRLADAEIVDLSDHTRARIRRSSRLMVNKLHCVDYGKLSREAQTKHNVAISIFGVLQQFSTESAVTRLTVEVQKTDHFLESAKAALILFGGKPK